MPRKIFRRHFIPFISKFGVSAGCSCCHLQSEMVLFEQPLKENDLFCNWSVCLEVSKYVSDENKDRRRDRGSTPLFSICQIHKSEKELKCNRTHKFAQNASLYFPSVYANLLVPKRIHLLANAWMYPFLFWFSREC
jgi:hypothetical protein